MHRAGVRAPALLLAAGSLSACQRDGTTPANAIPGNAASIAGSITPVDPPEARRERALPPLQPPAPGTEGGLPVAPPVAEEGAIDPKSAQGAAEVVTGYYGLLEENRFADAQKLWGEGLPQAREKPETFAARFAGFSEIHANIGAPGEPEGAAGSLYIAVPVQIYARVRATGAPYYALRSVTLRRVNDVDGATEAQRRWHITAIGPYRADAP
jgi:hypothetical protein